MGHRLVTHARAKANMHSESASQSRSHQLAAAAAATRPKDGVVIAGAPLSGADRWIEVYAPHLPVDCYHPQRLAEALGRPDEPYILNKAQAILTKLVEDNIRNQESLALVSELHGDEWAVRCLDQLRHAGYRIRLLLIYCEESVMMMRARRRNLDANDLIERQRGVIEQATVQAAKGARVELHHSRKGPPLHTHTIQDGNILYQSRLTLRRNVVWNQYCNEVAQRILAAKPRPGTRRSPGKKSQS